MELNKRNFWYLRHGQTDWNARYLAQGRSDVPLNATGVDQAYRAGLALADLFKNAEPFSRIVCSPLVRAQETARAVRREIHRAGGPLLDLSCEPLLSEVDFGVEEGNAIAPWYDAWITGGPAPKGGESFAELRDRAVRGVNRVTVGRGTALIVAHGALFRALRSAMDLDLTARLSNAAPVEVVAPEPPSKSWRLRFPEI